MKHGIHFRTAAKVFPDPKKMIREGEEYPEGLRYYQTTIKSLMARKLLSYVTIDEFRFAGGFIIGN